MSNLKTIVGEILRWGVIATCGGYGTWELLTGGWGIFTRRDGSWLGSLFMLAFLALVVTPLFVITYICLRRQYRKLFIVIGVIGSITVFAELMLLPEQLGVYQYVVRNPHDEPLFGMLALPAALLFLFGPIYGAAWFYRLCHYLAYPEMRGLRAKRRKTRATNWLVWLGVFVLVLPILGMLLLFSLRTSSGSMNAGVISDVGLHWLLALPLVSCMLMFLGLIWRRPMPDSEEEPSSRNSE